MTPALRTTLRHRIVTVMQNDRCVSPAGAMVVASFVVLVGLLVPDFGWAQAVTSGPTPPPTPQHEWTLIIEGAVIGGLIAPILEWLDYRFLGLLPIARIRRDQIKREASAVVRFDALEIALGDIAAMLRQSEGGMATKTSDKADTPAGEVSTAPRGTPDDTIPEPDLPTVS